MSNQNTQNLISYAFVVQTKKTSRNTPLPTLPSEFESKISENMDPGEIYFIETTSEGKKYVIWAKNLYKYLQKRPYNPYLATIRWPHHN